MSTTVTVGTAGRNYSSITAAHAAFAAGGWIMECYNDSEFVEDLSLGGTSATDYEILRPATGQSAWDSTSNPLTYDVTKGVGIRNSSGYGTDHILISGYCTLSRLQLITTATGFQVSGFRVAFGANNVVIERTLSINTNTSADDRKHRFLGNGNPQLLNVVLVIYSGYAIRAEYSSGAVFANVTAVCPSDKSVALTGFQLLAGSPSVINCASFNCTDFFAGGATPTGSNNATDAASISFGSSNLTNLTFANQFNGTTSAALDLTLKTGADLLNAGATDTADIPSAIDIFGTARPQGAAWDIGADEYIVPVVNAPPGQILMPYIMRR